MNEERRIQRMQDFIDAVLSDKQDFNLRALAWGNGLIKKDEEIDTQTLYKVCAAWANGESVVTNKIQPYLINGTVKFSMVVKTDKKDDVPLIADDLLTNYILNGTYFSDMEIKTIELLPSK